jgi:hypothetical protein
VLIFRAAEGTRVCRTGDVTISPTSGTGFASSYGVNMPGKREPSSNKELSDLELSAAGRRPEASSSAPLNPEQILEAILYLDLDWDRDSPTEGDNRILGRCIAALVVLLYLAMLLWMRHWLL